MGEPESIKVVLLGETGVGKTSIISQFTKNNFDPHQETSLSAQFISKTLEFPDLGQSIKFDIWDTVGQEKYRSLAKIFYKDAKVIILVYDVTRQVTFENLKNYWIEETKANSDGDAIFAVVANKIDLYQESQVKNEDGKAFANEIGAIFQSTSCLSNSGISTLFDNIGKKYLIPGYNYESGDKKAQEDYIKKKKDENNRGKKRVENKKGVKLEEKQHNKKKEKKGGFC
jgi:small GTP-binding protein